MQLQEEVDANADIHTNLQLKLQQLEEELEQERIKNNQAEEERISAVAAQEFQAQMDEKDTQMGNMEEMVKKYKKSLWILKKEFDKLNKKYEESQQEISTL